MRNRSAMVAALCLLFCRTALHLADQATEESPSPPIASNGRCPSDGLCLNCRVTEKPLERIRHASQRVVMEFRLLSLCLVFLPLPLLAQDGEVQTKQYDDGGVYEGTFKGGVQHGNGTPLVSACRTRFVPLPPPCLHSTCFRSHFGHGRTPGIGAIRVMSSWAMRTRRGTCSCAGPLQRT